MDRRESNQTWAWHFFTFVMDWPKSIIVAGVVAIIGFTSFIPMLEKDTRTDAFIPLDDPSLIFRENVTEIFGLQDPMVIALINEGENGVFNPHSLKLVEWLTRRLETVNNIDPDRITSLATENDIIGTEDGMLVEPFFETPPQTQKEANAVRTAVMDFPLYLGSLVSRDGIGTLIVAELVDQKKAQQVYEELLRIVEEAPTQEGEKLYVAGEGAVAGYMGAYIDADAVRLDPFAGLVITLICFVAFFTLRSALIPNLVVVATATSALGLMALSGINFFVITNALPIVLIGIAVADSIHILSQYYEEVVLHPEETPRNITFRTMLHMWRPVTLTSLTTIAGFLGLYLASMMPPMKYFGLFAMIGVGTAWVYSLTVVPAVLSLLKLKPSRAYQREANSESARVDGFGRMLDGLGQIVLRAPRRILLVAVAIITIGGIGTSKIQLDETTIRVFHPDELLHIADTTLNRVFDGTHYLDIMIETSEPEDLFKPENLKRIEDLQSWLETRSHVKGTTSIVDYLKQMNKALNEDRPEAYTLPDNPDLIAQYFLLYSASGDPTDFREEVDYDYQLAIVRASLYSGRYSIEKDVVESAQQYIDRHFNAPGIKAHLSGRVKVDYHWIKRLGKSHVVSVLIALFMVWLMATLSFRSAVAGTIALLPVVITVLMIYAVMGFSGIWLSVGTSMFAAISIGLGIDFSIHTIERLQTLLRDTRLSIDEAILKLYPSTGRALFFNFAAIALGFAVLTTSKVVVLHEFGTLVAVAVATSFISSMTVLPALVKVFKPAFLFKKSKEVETPTLLTHTATQTSV